MRRLLLLGMVCSGVQAASYVVSIGVEQYDDARISALKYAVADARAVAASFRAAGVPPRNVTVLTSEDRDPTRRPTRINVLRALERLKEQARDGDRLILFFAGHGVQEDDQQYLLTVDTSRALVSDTALPMRLVTKALSGVQASEVLFLLDACRNDPQAGRADSDATMTDGLARGLRPALSATTGPAPKVASLLACDVAQRAWEDPTTGHGAFTVALLRAMAGAAAGPDGQVRLKALADYVGQEVGRWALAQGKQQSPKLLNPDDCDMVVAIPPPEPVVSVALADQPLAAVVALLAEQYGAQIVLGKGVDAQARVTGKLDNQPLSAVLKVLLAAHDLRVRRENKVYIIEGPGVTPEPTPVTPDPVAPAPKFMGPVLTVARDGSGQYRTITEAVAAAPEGATIRIAPGTYREQVTLTKRLALVGAAGAEQTTMESVDTTPALRVEASALVQGLSFACHFRPAEPTYDPVVRLAGPAIRVADCRVTSDHGLGVSIVLSDNVQLERCWIGDCGTTGVQVIWGGRARMVDCVLERNCAQTRGFYQVVLHSGGSLEAQRLTVRGGHGGGLAVDASATLDLSEATVVDNRNYGVSVLRGNGAVRVADSRITGNGERAVWVNARASYAKDPATGLWVLLDRPPPQPRIPLPPVGPPPVFTNCDLRGNSRGAFTFEEGRTATAISCTFDPGDPTVPKDQAAAPTEGAFTGPTIAVARDGSGQYRTITEAVAAAPEGATIRVGPGTYRETLDLTKPVLICAEREPGSVVVETHEQAVLTLAAPVTVSIRALVLRQTGASRANPSPQERNQAPAAVRLDAGLLLLRVCEVTSTWDLPWAAVSAQYGGRAAERLVATDCLFESPGRAVSVAAVSAQLTGCRFAGDEAIHVWGGGKVDMVRGEIAVAKCGIRVDAQPLTGTLGEPGEAALTDCVVGGADYGAEVWRGGRLSLLRTTISGCRANAIHVDGQSTLQASACRFRDNALGAFGVVEGSKLVLSDNTYDPGDPTVPK